MADATVDVMALTLFFFFAHHFLRNLTDVCTSSWCAASGDHCKVLAVARSVALANISRYRDRHGDYSTQTPRRAATERHASALAHCSTKPTQVVKSILCHRDRTCRGFKMVLSFILIQNRQGKTRLAKWYAPYTDEEKVKLKGEACLHNQQMSNMLRGFLGSSPDCPTGPEVSVQLCRVSLCPFIIPRFQSSGLAGSAELIKHKDSV